jgi:hypothetical protein
MSIPLGSWIAALVDLGPLAALLIVVVAVMAVAVAKAFAGHGPGRGQPSQGRATAPSPSSYRYALVPFDDGDGTKDRPVLVLGIGTTSAKVLKVTSKPKPGQRNFRRVDTARWHRPGLREGSWVQTDKVVTISLTSFRRYLGDEHNVHFKRELVRLHPNELQQSHAGPAGSAQP